MKCCCFGSASWLSAKTCRANNNNNKFIHSFPSHVNLLFSKNIFRSDLDRRIVFFILKFAIKPKHGYHTMNLNIEIVGHTTICTSGFLVSKSLIVMIISVQSNRKFVWARPQPSKWLIWILSQHIHSKDSEYWMCRNSSGKHILTERFAYFHLQEETGNWEGKRSICYYRQRC